jgi:alpha-tubulin suppressor-like RCC1 family protein
LDYNEDLYFPTLLNDSFLGQTLAISAGYNHSLFFNTHDQVFIAGTDDSRPLGEFNFNQIKEISAGENFSLILNTQGQVCSFGVNDYGQLGLGETEEIISIPTMIDDSEMSEIMAVSAGTFHSLFLNVNGQVFGCGNYMHNNKRMTRSEYLSSRHKEYLRIPTLIDTQGLGTMIAVSAGGEHSLILNFQGQVFSFGANNVGQLGLGHLNPQSTPTLIESSVIGVIVAISAGSSHSLVLNSQGQVFGFGNNVCGQIGLGSLRVVRSPKLIDHPEIGRIVAISSGESHNLIMNQQGQVFSFGNNELGQLGLGKHEDKDDSDDDESSNEYSGDEDKYNVLTPTLIRDLII